MKNLRGVSSIKFIQSIFLIISFLSPLFLPSRPLINPPSINIKTSIQKAKDFSSKISSKTQPISHYSKDEVLGFIQSSRSAISLPPLVTNDQLCINSANIFNLTKDGRELSSNDLKSFCPDCIQKAYIVTQGNYKLENQDPWMTNQDITSLTHDQFTHTCVYVEDESVLILLGREASVRPEKPAISSNVDPKNFTKEQLWQALVDYRHAHEKPDLLQSENLCTYASKRVEEHIQMFAEREKEDYPVLEKYPLDAHEGFMRDGESQYLFDVTGFNVVAENLAYWPSAEYANQVIEWGWDTSTEGHREAQLSDDYTHACIMGRDGFYVAIFARN